MSTNNIEEILKSKGGGNFTVPEQAPKRRKRRRLYDVSPEVSSSVETESKLIPATPEEIKIEAPVKEEVDTEVKEVKVKPKKIKKITSGSSNKIKKDDAKEINKANRIAVSKPSKNFTAIPNEILEKVLSSNFSASEMRMILLIARKTLGWQQKVAFFSRKVFVEEGGVNPNSIDRVRNTLLTNKVIGELKGANNRKGYYLISEFFGITDGDKESVGDEAVPKEVSEVIKELKSEKIKKTEIDEYHSLVSQGYSSEILIDLAKHLLEKGDLREGLVSKPFAYLNSGTYEAVLNRFEGKNSQGINSSLIWEVLSEYDSKGPLPEEVKVKLTEKDLEWIEQNGGRHHLAMQKVVYFLTKYY